MFQLSRSQSTSIGFNPNFITQSAVDIIEKVGIIISSFGFKFKALIAISNAAVPLDTAIPNFLLLYFENSLSNSLTYEPSDDIQPVSRHFLTLILSSLKETAILAV